MTIDKTGTAPGLSGTQEALAPELNMKCPKCPSISAIEMHIKGIPAGSRMYQCTKCHATRVIAVGGHIEI